MCNVVLLMYRFEKLDLIFYVSKGNERKIFIFLLIILENF